MFLSQLGLLLAKNVRYMWRSRCWTIFEVAVPLLLSLPLVWLVSGYFTTEVTPATLYEDVEVTGNWDDVDRTFTQVETIAKYYCWKKMTFGYSSSSEAAKNPELEQFFADLASRYAGKLNNFSISMEKYESEKDMLHDLQNDTKLGHSCFQSYIGGLMVKKFDLHAPQLQYTLYFPNNQAGFGSWDLSTGAWHADDPFYVDPIGKQTTGGYKDYWSCGFLSLQYAVDDLFIKKTNISPNGEDFSLTLKRMPLPEYVQKSLTPFLGFLVFFWPLIAICNVVHTASTIAGEKDSGMAAYLHVMGLSFLEYYLSHGIVSFLKLAVVFVPCALILLPGFVVVSGGLFLFAILVYSVGVVCFAMLMTSVFHKSGAATKGALIIWMLSVALEAFCKLQIPSTHILRSLLAALNINFALAKATDAIRDSMNRDLFLGFSNCFDGSTYFFTFGLGIVMLVVDIVWMVLLMVYLDNVYPPGDLPRRNFFYFLTPCWKSSKERIKEFESEDDETDANANIEPDCGTGNSDNADIDVRGLTKVYETVRAVDSFAFRAQRGNITVLLGHNGAGKSTTFAMLTGLAAPTAGSIKICGIELTPGTLRKCQKKLGFCPQYNPIFDLMTVREHLELCRKLKENPDDCIDKLLDDLQLKDKANELAKNLSGGMKRKLCIAMSLVGGSQVVLLDEPTAGLDTGARHLVDDLLRRYKAEKTVLLTTHYMDEADSVGDRISIMVNGRLACSGSSEFLKSRYGTGYLLTIALKPGTPTARVKENIMNTIKYLVENATIQSETSHQLTVLLPAEDKPKFASLFAQLENGGPTLGIDTFGVSLNTMEQVFLRVGELADNGSATEDSVDMAKRQASRLCDNTSRVNRGCLLWLQQLEILLYKQAVCLKRKWSRLISQFFLPMAFLVMIVYMAKTEHSSPTKRSEDEIFINMEELAPVGIPFQPKGEGNAFAQNVKKMLKDIRGYEVMPLNASEDMEKFILKRPKVLPPLGIGFSISNGSSAKTFFNGIAKRGPAIALSAVSNARAGGVADAIVTSLHVYSESSVRESFSSYSATVDDTVQKFLVVVLIFIFGMLVSGFIMQLVDEKRANFKHQQLLTGLSPVMYWLSVVIFDFLFYVITCCALVIIFWTANFRVSGPLAVIFLVYFWASMPLVCCASFLFTSSVKAYVMMILYTLVLPVFSLPIVFILAYFHPTLHNIFEPIFMLVEPNYVMQSGILSVLDGSASYAWGSLGKPMFMLFLSGLFFWLLLFALQARLISSFIVKMRNARRVAVDTLTEDRDVADERERMNSISEDELAIAVRNLNKYFGSLHAVKNLTFGVRTDECFGLLGANGAGKTTTFDVLTGVSLSDGGAATINGQLVSRIRALGFCPQFDALLEDLTARETLKIMVTLRGYTDVRERIENVLEAIALSDRADKLVTKYSGGQRRRLSVGLALISQARVILLDEPTAGIDPKTRRQIWDLLSAMRDESCAMLLTSHSMEECEALCTRIGILFQGALKAIGAPQRIKSRFGEGYSVTFTLKNEGVRDEVVDAVSATFPQAELKTLHPSIHLSYHLKRSDGDRWSTLFDAVHRFASSRREIISDYSLAQTTLEEAFLRLSQMDEEDVAARAHRNISLDVSSLV